MGLGAYSVVRYTDDLSDQRINLGVFVWHPVDGYRCRLSPALDRVQAIDPRVAITPLRRQLEGIKESLTSAKPENKNILDELCQTFRHGLVVSSPYPAKICSADETLERLYHLVVSPVNEIRRASSQKMFENSLRKTLEATLAGWPKGRFHQLGSKNIDGIHINIGLRTQIGHAGPAALWHPISLQSENRPEIQLATAKATILDIIKTRVLEAYKRDTQFVAVLAPRTKSSTRMDDVVGSLEAVADEVLVAKDNETLLAHVNAGLISVLDSPQHRRAR
jgi:Protein of unknown function (DUF3037)